MKIKVLGETELCLSHWEEDDIDIDTGKLPRFSALAMFIASLGRCTFAVIDHYALRMDVPIENIVTHLEWEFDTDPTRFKTITMKIYWPEIPEKRIASVERASHKCTISTTIKECVNIETVVLKESYPG